MKKELNQISDKEIEIYKTQIEEARKFSTDLDVKTEDDYQEAMAYGIQVKNQLEMIVHRKEVITKPMNAALKSVRDLFRPLEDAGNEALQIIKKRMLRFTTEKERIANEAKAKIDARVEKGTMKEGTAEVKKFIIDQSSKKTVSSNEGSSTTKKVKKYYVTDLSQIPLEFILPDMVKIKASFKSGFPVPGIEERLESELAFNAY